MRLEDFPKELLWRIVDELDDVSKVCLKSTSYYFRCSIKVDIAKLSVCSKWLLMCRFETDYYTHMKAYPPRVACAFCKMKVDQECIDPKRYTNTVRSSGSQVLKPMSKKPVERFCVLHAAKHFRLGDVVQDRQEGNPPRWTKKTQLTCLHCGGDVEAGDGRSVGCNACRCDVCPRAKQPRFELSGCLSHPHVRPSFCSGPENKLSIFDWSSKVL